MSKQRVNVEAVLAGKSKRSIAQLYGVSQPRGLKPGPQPGNKKGGMPKGFKFKK
jgi:hypothetical protein